MVGRRNARSILVLEGLDRPPGPFCASRRRAGPSGRRPTRPRTAHSYSSISRRISACSATASGSRRLPGC